MNSLEQSNDKTTTMKSILSEDTANEDESGDENDYHIAPDENVTMKKISEESEHDEASLKSEEQPPTILDRLKHFYEKESLLIEVGIVVFLAFLYPPMGAIYIAPEITAHWVAVIIIFCKLKLCLAKCSRLLFHI